MRIALKKSAVWALYLAAIATLVYFISISASGSYASDSVGASAGVEYQIMIYIHEKRLYLFKNNQYVKDYPIASGKPGWPSPTGQWEIAEKGQWGKWFGGYWMGLNVPWGVFGIHGTTNEGSVGSAASHGCIRMFRSHAKDLYNTVPEGTPVLIVNGVYGAFGMGFRKLLPGDSGTDVLEVQKRLKTLGYDAGPLSGYYGDELKKALVRFEKDHSLTVTDAISRDLYEAMGLYEFE